MHIPGQTFIPDLLKWFDSALQNLLVSFPPVLISFIMQILTYPSRIVFSPIRSSLNLLTYVTPSAVILSGDTLFSIRLPMRKSTDRPNRHQRMRKQLKHPRPRKRKKRKKKRKTKRKRKKRKSRKQRKNRNPLQQPLPSNPLPRA